MTFKIITLLQNITELYYRVSLFCSVALDSLESLVEQMKTDNKSSAGVVMGDVIGILQMQAENTETEDLCYSIDQNMINVRPEKH